MIEQDNYTYTHPTRESPQRRSPYKHGPGSEGERLEDVRPVPYTPVHIDLHLVPYRLHYVLQHLDL